MMKKLAALALLGISISCAGQNILSKTITLDVTRQRIDQVLEIISNKGDFYFSYNSKIIPKDSLVSFSVRNKAVRDVLHLIFNTSYEFKESGNYLIIRKAPVRMTMIAKKAPEQENIYFVSGHVYDEQSGLAVNEASVYEKNQLVSAVTDELGYFKLKLKGGKQNNATISVSRQQYEDTSIAIEPRHNQELTITMIPVEKPMDKVIVAPEDIHLPDSVREEKNNTDSVAAVAPTRKDSAAVEKTGMGRFFLSAKQKIQSMNLDHFFATKPFQVSLVPGLGSHGSMSGQVINHFSLNVLGGYTAGTHGMEIGGLFNIDKKDARYFQVAGLFNIVGGRVDGVQIGGINNTVLDNVNGFQVAGINNHVSGSFKGFQLGGIYNHVADSMTGLQVAGISSFTRDRLSGVQISGIGNISAGETNGLQLAGVFNYSKRLKGVQIGLINIADSSDGFSIGLINIVLKGYHKLSFFSNEVTNVNASFKTGNSKLYSILHAGLNAGDSNRVYTFGYGLGSERFLNKKRTLSLNPEISSQYLYLGSWDYTNILNRLELNLNVKLGKYVSIFAGPSYSVYVSNQTTGIKGYKYPIPGPGYNTTRFGNQVTAWLGWNAGISFF
jgi:hypothetical protein